jgi:hypothetical protein
MTTKWIETLAMDFWEEAGSEELFPRSLEGVIVVTKPVLILKLSGLRLLAVRDWLGRRRFTLPVETPDRWLHGCLVAYRGTGFIFVEGGLDAAEIRVTVAHEFAHFLAEYEWPRRRVGRRLGPSVWPVLDGDRQATGAEGLGAALAGVELGVHVHYLERLADGTCPPPAGAVERTANALALELLAPRRVALAEVQADAARAADPARWHEILQRRFGLPGNWARPYALRLEADARRRRTFSATLGL